MRIRRTVSTLAAAALVATLVTVASPSGPVGAATTTSCADPGRGQSFPARSPGSLGFDAAKLDAAVRFASRQSSTSVRVYRHGCLAAKSGLDIVSERVPYPLASSSKGVASLIVGRAVTLGYVDLDAPISTYISRLDAEHGALTTRQILQQVTGLKFSWAADVAGYATDPTRQALALPFAHEPGTTYEYAQSILSVLATIVQNATGAEFLQFAQRELFERSASRATTGSGCVTAAASRWSPGDWRCVPSRKPGSAS
jgi:CubicO group peptidase (beta-lactamase class C family)